MLAVRPDLPDVSALFRVLFRLAREQKVLAVIDEFPLMLGATATEARTALSSLLAVMEAERERSRLKLILCGSQVAQMEALCRSVLERDSPLFNEGRRIVDQELREPRLYFAILEQLAMGGRGANEIAQRIGVETNAVHKYLVNLEALRLVSRQFPFGAAPDSRTTRWRLDDSFVRFWFRFVFPYQSDLESGLVPQALFDREIAHLVGEHVAPLRGVVCELVAFERARRSIPIRFLVGAFAS